VGKLLDGSFRDYLHRNNIDPCGENGEYHTIVVDGPLFSHKLSLATGNVISKNEYRLLDMKNVKLENAVS